MKTRARFYFNRASISLAALMVAGGMAMADDTTQQTADTAKKDVPKKVVAVKKDDTVKKQQVAAKPADKDSKDAKRVADSASKLDLATPVSHLNFYGSATVGYEATFGKTACSGKNVHQDGMFSDVMVGTDFKLSKDVTMSVQMQAGQYPNGFGFH